MEFSFYGRILKRWLWLIALGTLLALAVGVLIEYQSRIAASPSYQAKSTVTVNCVAPGCVYVAGVSASSVEDGLITRVNDPGATQVSPRVPGPRFSSLTAFIDPITGTLTVQAVAATRLDAVTASNLAARYLATIQNVRVHQLSLPVIAHYRSLANYAKVLWLRYVRLLARAPAGAFVHRAVLQSKSNYWQNLYTTYAQNVSSFQYPALPPASVTPAGGATKYQSKPLSPIKTVIPAAIIGLVLSFLLATILEMKSSNVGVPSSEPGPAGSRPSPLPGVPAGSSAMISSSLGADSQRSREPDVTGQLLTLADFVRPTSELIAQLLDEAHPSILVTSPTLAEPKSESSAGLAAALAQSGKRVILLDADPLATLSLFFNLADRPGLIDFLGFPQGPIQQLVYPVDLPGAKGSLWLLPYGVAPSDESSADSASRLSTASEAWSAVFSQLQLPGVVLLVDGPALLEHEEPIPAANNVGGIIIALARERDGPDVTEAYEKLGSSRSKVLGVIANPVSVRLPNHDGPNSFSAEPDHTTESDETEAAPRVSIGEDTSSQDASAYQAG